MPETIIKATFVDGGTDQLTFNPDNPHYTTLFMPNGATDINMVQVSVLTDAGDISEKNPQGVCYFVETCVPEFPLYVRWINYLGGYEYHMFHMNKAWVRSVNPNNYQVAQSYKFDQLRTRATLNMEVTDTVECGENMLSRDDWEFLSSILTSPQISVYNENLSQWENAVIDSRQSCTWNTRNSRGEVNITLRLLDQDTQF